MVYKAPIWMPGGHLQTIWAALFARNRWHEPQRLERERWSTPDGDFLDIDRQNASAKHKPLLVLFHGLEGSSSSHYAKAFADWAAEQDVNLVIPHFRGCSGQLNWAPRAYHSGDHEEIDWLLDRLRKEHRSFGGQKLMAVGVSLGGNALIRWAGEHGSSSVNKTDAIASVCSPLDLLESGHAIGQGLNRLFYTPMFLRTMKPKAMAKWHQHPGLFDKEALLSANDLYTFDGVFTAPLHGFDSTEDYWRRASAKPLMHQIRVPALVLNSLNDPFVPAKSLPTAKDVSSYVELWQPQQGGHVGFPLGTWPAHVRALPDTVGAWLMQTAGLVHTTQDMTHG